MKVSYHGPGERTFHPELGELTKVPFDIDPKVAKPYLESGLLVEVKKEKREDRAQDAGSLSSGLTKGLKQKGIK